MPESTGNKRNLEHFDNIEVSTPPTYKQKRGYYNNVVNRSSKNKKASSPSKFIEIHENNSTHTVEQRTINNNASWKRMDICDDVNIGELYGGCDEMEATKAREMEERCAQRKAKKYKALQNWATAITKWYIFLRILLPVIMSHSQKQNIFL
ncbi:hypothetical protein BDA99DRAFT_502783 [Phascolomyces articulosus]|uniref:Uncharacterized protein n=1 Tax=Phascolomyces articulosus TaxID=60185 RepID=A0AAD5KF08_9FUNG|nr:hypothetical protein BDA99DRAFT_502783 [Phascolomyces articulosus]